MSILSISNPHALSLWIITTAYGNLCEIDISAQLFFRFGFPLESFSIPIKSIPNFLHPFFNASLEEQKVESDKFKGVESSLITTLKTAEDTGSKIVEKAKEDVKSILDDSRQELNNIKEEYDKVKSLRDSITEEINNLSKKIDEGISDINNRV